MNVQNKANIQRVSAGPTFIDTPTLDSIKLERGYRCGVEHNIVFCCVECKQ